MVLKSLLMVLLVTTACGKSVKVNVGKSDLPQAERGTVQELKSEQRAFDYKELELLSTVCKVFKTKKEHFADTMNGKKFYFNFKSTNCAGVSTQKLNIPLTLTIFNEDQLMYKASALESNLQYFPEEETDRRGLMQDICSKSGSVIQTINITFEETSKAEKVSVVAVPPNNIKVTVENYQREKNSNYFKLNTLSEMEVLTNDNRGTDLIGMVVEQTQRKYCNGENRSTKMDELKATFLKI